eukprot:GHVR01117717.1.p1 GENE.GHVR01117717.1~~GHVR01117717.1.p1  ORF type:complete len:109 (+),score=5.62 GHVR01117717.1:371-697(+)
MSSYVIFTVIVENAYPLKLVNSFINSISIAFFDEVKCLLGSDNYQSRLESIEGSHYFVKFDRTIKQKVKEFDDPNSLKNVERMKKELETIHDLMLENMNLLDSRQTDL